MARWGCTQLKSNKRHDLTDCICGIAPTAQCSCLHGANWLEYDGVLFVCHIQGSTTWIWHKPEARRRPWFLLEAKGEAVMTSSMYTKQEIDMEFIQERHSRPVRQWGYVVRPSLDLWILSSPSSTLLGYA
jgi:hypothetical protein